MNADQLDQITRVIGTVIALVGAVVGAPGGWARFRGNAFRRLRAAVAPLRALTRRLLGRGIIIERTLLDVVGVIDAVTASGSGWVWRPISDSVSISRGPNASSSRRFRRGHPCHWLPRAM